jgi:ADP-heptose:LPS heptosyltransferase
MKVLIIKLGALGDVVMASGLIATIQRHHDADDVCLLTSAPFASLFEAWPGIQVQAFGRRGAMLRTLRWLRKRRFDRVYDLQSNDRSSVLLACSGIPARIGNHPRFPYHIHPTEQWTGQCHIFERMNQVLAAAGLPATAAKPRLPAPPPIQQQVRDWLAAQALDERSFAVCHAGASRRRENKRWPYFLELARVLEARGLRCVWVGADDDREINTALAAGTGINATNAFDILGLVELGRHARFAVTNDSGPMHVLSAADIPVFALFGPSDWRRNHALGQQQRVIRSKQPCPACDGKRRDHTCLSSIPAAQVIVRLEAEKLL